MPGDDVLKESKLKRNRVYLTHNEAYRSHIVTVFSIHTFGNVAQFSSNFTSQ